MENVQARPQSTLGPSFGQMQSPVAQANRSSESGSGFAERSASKTAFMAAPIFIVPLIFGGCCCNVFALEAIVRVVADSGLLITFLQFVFCALVAYPTQFDLNGRFNLKATGVPIRKWLWIATMFYSVNMLNNWAFAFNISVPVHIILRSFGSVITMLAGYIRGKRFTVIQVSSVILLTIGVMVSAWADAAGKGKDLSAKSETSMTVFVSGLLVLLIAQILSAYMGVYVQETYANHGANWLENLFYSHLFSLPMFLPLSSVLRRQNHRLAATSPLSLTSSLKSVPAAYRPVAELLTPIIKLLEVIPQGQLFLLLNALTQLACISGVNLLSARASAVTVTIVLNVRKLVSFLFSTFLFGHKLSGLMIIGAALVFGSGALYGWESSWRIPRQKKLEQQTPVKAANGKAVHANGNKQKHK